VKEPLQGHRAHCQGRLRVLWERRREPEISAIFVPVGTQRAARCGACRWVGTPEPARG
jgi:hypothetical protein